MFLGEDHSSARLAQWPTRPTREGCRFYPMSARNTQGGRTRAKKSCQSGEPVAPKLWRTEFASTRWANGRQVGLTAFRWPGPPPTIWEGCRFYRWGGI